MRSKIHRIPLLKYSEQDPGSTGSLKKLSLQYETSSKILDIRSCVSPVSFHTTEKKTLEEAPKVHTVYQNRLSNRRRPAQANKFSRSKIQDPQDPAPIFLNKIQNSQGLVKTVWRRIHWILQKMPTQDPGSINIPDPESCRSWIPNLPWILAHVC